MEGFDLSPHIERFNSQYEIQVPEDIWLNPILLERISFQPPESLDETIDNLLLKRVLKQNRGVIEAKIQDLKAQNYPEFLVVTSEILHTSIYSEPEFIYWENAPLNKDAIYKNGKILFNPTFVISKLLSKEEKKNIIFHELSHALSEEITTPLIQDFYISSHDYKLSYVFNMEGFAQWLAKIVNKGKLWANNRITTYDQLSFNLSYNSHNRDNILEKVYDDPYQFGAIAYDVIHQAFGVEKVLKTIRKPTSRYDLLTQFKLGCQSLGLNDFNLKAKPVRTDLTDLYQELIAEGKCKKDSRIKKHLRAAENEITRLLAKKVPPNLAIHDAPLDLLHVIHRSGLDYTAFHGDEWKTPSINPNVCELGYNFCVLNPDEVERLIRKEFNLEININHPPYADYSEKGIFKSYITLYSIDKTLDLYRRCTSRIIGYQGDLKEIESDIDKLTKLEKNNPYVHYMRGVYHYRKGNFDEAILCFDKCVELNPKYIAALEYKIDTQNRLQISTEYSTQQLLKTAKIMSDEEIDRFQRGYNLFKDYFNECRSLTSSPTILTTLYSFLNNLSSFLSIE